MSDKSFSQLIDSNRESLDDTYIQLSEGVIKKLDPDFVEDMLRFAGEFLSGVDGRTDYETILSNFMLDLSDEVKDSNLSGGITEKDVIKIVKKSPLKRKYKTINIKNYIENFFKNPQKFKKRYV